MAYQNQTGDRLKEITDKLEKGLQDLFSSGQYADYLKTMSKFYGYSASNTLLIYMQRPDASHVAGYGDWQKTLSATSSGANTVSRFWPPAPTNSRWSGSRPARTGGPSPSPRK